MRHNLFFRRISFCEERAKRVRRKNAKYFPETRSDRVALVATRARQSVRPSRGAESCGCCFLKTQYRERVAVAVNWMPESVATSREKIQPRVLQKWHSLPIQKAGFLPCLTVWPPPPLSFPGRVGSARSLADWSVR